MCFIDSQKKHLRKFLFEGQSYRIVVSSSATNLIFNLEIFVTCLTIEVLIDNMRMRLTDEMFQWDLVFGCIRQEELFSLTLPLSHLMASSGGKNQCFIRIHTSSLKKLFSWKFLSSYFHFLLFFVKVHSL